MNEYIFRFSLLCSFFAQNFHQMSESKFHSFFSPWKAKNNERDSMAIFYQLNHEKGKSYTYDHYKHCGLSMPRADCNPRLENGRLQTGRLQTGHFETPRFPPSAQHWNNSRTSPANFEPGFRIHDQNLWNQENKFRHSTVVFCVNPAYVYQHGLKFVGSKIGQNFHSWNFLARLAS